MSTSERNKKCKQAKEKKNGKPKIIGEINYPARYALPGQGFKEKAAVSQFIAGPALEHLYQFLKEANDKKKL